MHWWHSIQRRWGPSRPTFVLGVGAQKAGTTWLYEYLKVCDGCNLGDLKEYHIWDGLLQPRLFPEHDYRSSFTQPEKGRDLRKKLQANPREYVRYFRDQVQAYNLTADITPSYCGLSTKDFRQIRRKLRFGGFLPKVVFLMRDPVQRCWSACRMYARNEAMNGGRKWSDEDMAKHFSTTYGSQHYQIRTNYQRTVESLERAFQPEEVYFGFFEDMFEGKQLYELSNFLNVPLDLSQSQRVRNDSPAAALPKDVHHHCREFYRSTYEYCAFRFPKSRTLWASE
ncbi:MAG: sulfotransferase [Alphaproteobacteria bacterium]|nr:sulfotransferase [Alphaproteobacteria bacterium]